MSPEMAQAISFAAKTNPRRIIMPKRHHVGGKKHLKKASGKKGHRKGRHSKKTAIKA